MTPLETILVVGIIFLIVLFMGHPLAFTLGGLGIIFGATLWGNPGVLNLFVRSTNNLITSIAYASIPLFIFMGAVLERSGAADDLFESMYVILGRLRGGLAITTVVICTLLAAASGIIGASITVMGMLALPSMLKHRYNPELATGTIMAAGCLGTLIPPSIILIIYGAQAQISIGKLFAGGIGAGLVLSGLYIIYILVLCLLKPKSGPAIAPEEAGRYTSQQKIFMAIKSILPTLGLILMVLGSILFGVATPTEAAALGAVGALLIAALHHRLNWQMVKETSFATMKTTAMIMYIILTASMFTSVFLGLGGGQVISSIVNGLNMNRWLILSVILFIVYIMGMFIDSYGVLLIGVPIFTPVVYALGFDPIWFAILFAVMIQMSYLSPPFAYAVFYLRGIAPKEISTAQLYRACFPFIALQVISLIILSLFPAIITWLPSKIM
ncbi:tripartite transporter large subunit [Moorella sp. E308F]|uniref:TRAP transporter large permease n=1 Tax=Moorella sp. E308F TaxID=2572682 RepID=UPI0010FFBCC0|nr:TRAP transporter large permease subunit [Moorella sp. E308F]GEA14748.1 tripartite transporter large subunit [Moorella sp. E308F]